MKNKLLKALSVVLMCGAVVFTAQSSTYILKSEIATVLNSTEYSYAGPYTYMAYDGSLVTTVTGGGESAYMASLLSAIQAKYGSDAAQIYYQCAQNGTFTAYYNMVGNSKPTFYEQFTYETNGLVIDSFGPMVTEESLYITGCSSVSEMVQASQNAGYSSIMEYERAVKRGQVAKPTSATKAQSSATATPPAETAQVVTEEKKEISHGLYDNLDKTAETAFKDFLSDGVDGSCYIQVKNDAEDKTIGAKTISKTFSGKEGGTVEFYNAGEDGKYEEFSYSVNFPQIEEKHDVNLDATYSALENTKYENVYKFGFNEEQKLENEVILTVNVSGDEGTTFYLLRGTNDDDYNTFATSCVDGNGNIVFQTDTLDDIIITTTDIVSMRQAEEEAIKEAEKAALEASNESSVVEASTDITTEANSVTDENEKSISSEPKNIYMPIIIIASAIVALLGAILGVIFYRKNRR